MSFGGDNVTGPLGEPPVELLEPHPKSTYRSYKKKYRKMKHTFEEKMRESTSLFKEEQRATDIARRLQENNDQLLDLLLDINNSCRISLPLQFDIRYPPFESSEIPALEYDTLPIDLYDSVAASAALKEAQADLASGGLSPNACSHVAGALGSKIRPLSLESLRITPHTTLSSITFGALPDEIGSETPPGYLTPKHDDDYLFALDSYLGNSPVLPRANASTSLLRLGERSFEKEKEVQVRNPVSVYNWLRKHQPQVFLQDNEPVSDKSSAKVANPSKATKRPSIAAKPDHGIIDDEGFLIGESVGSIKSKRKREDEPYRPKGGSSRPAKRKREDGGSGGKKVRKIASASNGS